MKRNLQVSVTTNLLFSLFIYFPFNLSFFISALLFLSNRVSPGLAVSFIYHFHSPLFSLSNPKTKYPVVAASSSFGGF